MEVSFLVLMSILLRSEESLPVNDAGKLARKKPPRLTKQGAKALHRRRAFTPLGFAKFAVRLNGHRVN
jgi:hypothetical protein